MRLPLAIYVGAMKYIVSDDVNELNKASREQRADLAGQSDHKFLRVVIDPDQAAGQKADTLLHECLHIVTQQAGLADEWGMEEDEKVVRRLTPWLLDILTKNPTLVSYLRNPS